MKTHTCSGCGATIPARRKSTITGDHWCSSPPCQSKKQIAWRRSKAERALDDGPLSRDDARKQFIAAALDPTLRKTCDICGLEGAIIGFAHIAADGGVCLFLGRRGNRVGRDWIDLVHPSRALNREA